MVGLVGDNGAGKSTLVKVMSGVHPPDTGKVFFDGREVTINSPRDSTNLGIETVYQDLALCDNLKVVANLYVGRELKKPVLLGLLHRLEEIAMEKNTIRLLNELHIPIPSVRNLIACLGRLGSRHHFNSNHHAYLLWGTKTARSCRSSGQTDIDGDCPAFDYFNCYSGCRRIDEYQPKPDQYE